MNFSQIVCICQARQRRQFMTPFSIIATNHNEGFSINSKGGFQIISAQMPASSAKTK